MNGAITAIPLIEEKRATTFPIQPRIAYLHAIRSIALKEFGDRYRSGWIIALAAVWLGAICLTSFFGLLQVGQLGVQGYERTVVSLLNLVQYLVPLLGLLIGHDLLVAECEDRTLPLILSTGIPRIALLIGKFIGGALTAAFPLVLGFVIAGAAIALNASAAGLAAFIRLAATGLGLAIVFVAVGLAISTVTRTRVKALIVALLTWCFIVFVFDLVALGALLAIKAPKAAQEIEIACDTTHINEGADVHAMFSDPTVAPASANGAANAPTFSWILLNPVDLFRAANLPAQHKISVPYQLLIATPMMWITAFMAFSSWRFRKQDL